VLTVPLFIESHFPAGSAAKEPCAAKWDAPGDLWPRKSGQTNNSTDARWTRLRRGKRHRSGQTQRRGPTALGEVAASRRC
jgi:hypothetical protein